MVAAHTEVTVIFGNPEVEQDGVFVIAWISMDIKNRTQRSVSGYDYDFVYTLLGDVLSNQIFAHLFFELPQVTADNTFMHMTRASKAFFRLIGMI